MYCNSCGHKNDEEARYCSSCGLAIRSDDTTVTFTAVETDEDDGKEVDLPLDDLGANQALLVVVKGPNVGARYFIDQPITTIGRHPDSDVFLDDITVSRRHSEIACSQEGEFHLKDSGSLNGTYVNRERVEEAVLSSGDELQVGKFRFVFYKGEA